MNHDEFRKLEELFDAAVGLDDQSLDSLLVDAHRAHPAIANRLANMLSMDSLGAPDVGFRCEPKSPNGHDLFRLCLPDRYQVIAQLGEGGFGVVYLALQTHPIRRMVAIKIIKRGMDTESVLKRFDDERQALAMMDHPAIVSAIDAGSTDDGRPFVVMPLVPGMPITQYCIERSLSLREKLELFICVCEGIQHAHARGVIHRDLKPANILVIFEESTHRAKIIDFGLAKALSQPLTPHHSLTVQGQLIGTPEYMAPEQALEKPSDVRSDVYSLGAILYELISGKPPFGGEHLLQQGRESLRQVLAQEIPKSLRVKHQTVPREVDWITLRCLEKDLARRFQTVDGLIEDLQRFLRGDNVSSGPPARLHRLRRLGTRYKLPIAASLIGILSILIGAGAALQFAHRASQDRAHAVAVSRSLREVLTSVNPAVAQGRDTELLQMMLANGSETIDWNSLNPQVDLEVSEAFAQAYSTIGRLDEADRFAARALHRLEESEGRDSCRRLPLLLIRLHLISNLTVDDSRLKQTPAVRAEVDRLVSNCFVQNSESQLQARVDLALAIPREMEMMLPLHEDLLRYLGPDDRNTILIGRHAAWTEDLVQARQAILLMDEFRERASKLFGTNDPLVHSEIALEMYFRGIGELPMEDQEAWAREHIPDAERVLGRFGKGVIRAQYNHANILSLLGRHEECLAKFEDVYERESQAFGERTNMARWIDASHALAALRAGDWKRFQEIESRMWTLEPDLPSGDRLQQIEMIGLLREQGEHPRAERWIRGFELKAPQFREQIP
ncbi:MAG: serine/threonine-protein kinase [Phycisphaerales bacterium]